MTENNFILDDIFDADAQSSDNLQDVLDMIMNSEEVAEDKQSDAGEISATNTAIGNHTEVKHDNEERVPEAGRERLDDGIFKQEQDENATKEEKDSTEPELFGNRTDQTNFEFLSSGKESRSTENADKNYKVDDFFNTINTEVPSSDDFFKNLSSLTDNKPVSTASIDDNPFGDDFFSGKPKASAGIDDNPFGDDFFSDKPKAAAGIDDNPFVDDLSSCSKLETKADFDGNPFVELNDNSFVEKEKTKEKIDDGEVSVNLTDDNPFW